MAVVAPAASLVGCQSSDVKPDHQASTIAYVRSISVSGFTDGPFIGEILVMRSDGSGKTELTHNRAGTEDGSPTWSPDGRTIAFTRSRNGPPAIYVVSADGGGARRLVENASSPTWSPDGTRIAFVALDEPGRISIVNSDGSGQRDLVGSGPNDSDPLWSPDGEAIAFVRDRPTSGGGETDLWSVAVDGGTPRQLLRRVEAYAFEWSPEGDRLAFMRQVLGDRNELGVASADGTDLRRVAIFDGYVTGPRWSPDGRKLAVTANGIFVVSVEDGLRQQLTHEDDHSLAWSPDGRELAFVRYPNVATIKANGGPVRLLTHGPEHWQPTWSLPGG